MADWFAMAEDCGWSLTLVYLGAVGGQPCATVVTNRSGGGGVDVAAASLREMDRGGFAARAEIDRRPLPLEERALRAAAQAIDEGSGEALDELLPILGRLIPDHVEPRRPWANEGFDGMVVDRVQHSPPAIEVDGGCWLIGAQTVHPLALRLTLHEHGRSLRVTGGVGEAHATAGTLVRHRSMSHATQRVRDHDADLDWFFRFAFTVGVPAAFGRR